MHPTYIGHYSITQSIFTALKVLSFIHPSLHPSSEPLILFSVSIIFPIHSALLVISSTWEAEAGDLQKSRGSGLYCAMLMRCPQCIRHHYGDLLTQGIPPGSLRRAELTQVENIAGSNPHANFLVFLFYWSDIIYIFILWQLKLSFIIYLLRICVC